ncbi:MAG: glucokinase, partial [Thermoanaerobaculia bacterium]
MTENPDAPALVADIGGTHVRFALSAASGGLGCRQTLDCADFESPADAGESYLSGLQLGLDRLEVINDFTAIALAIPTLGGEDRRRLKPGEPRAGSPFAILGPGTGLGVSA